MTAPFFHVCATLIGLFQHKTTWPTVVIRNHGDRVPLYRSRCPDSQLVCSGATSRSAVFYMSISWLSIVSRALFGIIYIFYYIYIYIYMFAQLPSSTVVRYSVAEWRRSSYTGNSLLPRKLVTWPRHTWRNHVTCHRRTIMIVWCVFHGACAIGLHYLAMERHVPYLSTLFRVSK